MNEQQSSNTSVSTPQAIQHGDTHSYKGWLNSDSFLKRTFAVYGYNMVASLIVSIPIMIIVGIFAAIFGALIAGAIAGGVHHDNVVPTPAPMVGKLDINAVCDGALAYMTFPTGAEAEQFVAECKDGKHPEVIEQYRQQMGADDSMAL